MRGGWVMGVEQRRSVRVAGPFDGWRVTNAIETPIRIYNLSEGGCFITSLHEAPAPGRKLVLKIELPKEGWIDVKGETLYAREEFGYAVRFSEMSSDAFTRLERALNALRVVAE